jgi:hypothetical protein
MPHHLGARLFALLVPAFWIYVIVAIVATLEALLLSIEAVGPFLIVSLFTLPGIIAYLTCEEFASKQNGRKYGLFCLASSPIFIICLIVLCRDTSDAEVYDLAKGTILVFLSLASIALLLLQFRNRLHRSRLTK